MDIENILSKINNETKILKQPKYITTQIIPKHKIENKEIENKEIEIKLKTEDLEALIYFLELWIDQVNNDNEYEYELCENKFKISSEIPKEEFIELFYKIPFNNMNENNIINYTIQKIRRKNKIMFY